MLRQVVNVLCAILLVGAASEALSKPVTYTAFTVTSGQIGSWSFQNAAVYLTFSGDTSTVQTIDVPNIFDPTTMTEAVFNATGTATVTVITARKIVHATFLPNQIFVSLDHGTLPGPFRGGRGVGFGMFSPTAAGGIEPAYPLGIEDGTIDWGDATLPSAALPTLPIDLQHSTLFSGRSWSCIGFPDTTCPAPTQPLKTNKGDLFLSQPYENLDFEDTLGGGLFTANVREAGWSGDDTPFATMAPALTASSAAATTALQTAQKPIVYVGALVSNAKLGHTFYDHAQVFLAFEADRSTARSYQDASSSGYINTVGRGRLILIQGSRLVTASFAPGQLYVYYDKTHGSAGFGSKAGGRGYPFSVTRNEDTEGLVENSTVGAVTDILSGAQASTSFTPEVATLATDLTNETTLSGGVSSCVAFDPATSICTDLTPIPLKTSAGDFYLYEPYTDDETTADGSQPYTINWGIFWSQIPR